MSKISTLKEFTEKARRIHGNKYDYSKAIYLGSQIKICIICPIHGEFWQTPAGHLQGKNCWHCRNNNLTKIQTFTLEEFIRKAKLIHGEKYDYSKVVYKGYNVKVIIICPTHGEFLQSPYKHLEGRGCWQCKSSKGELAIKAILDKYDIKYKKEFKFNNETKKYRYDFYLPIHNVLIEFHGGQHYYAIDFFGGQNRLKYTQESDKKKQKLAKYYKIPLIIFNYKHLRLKREEFEKLFFNTIKQVIENPSKNKFIYEINPPIENTLTI